MAEVAVGGVSAGLDRKRANERASMGTLTAADFSLQKMIEETLPVPLSVTTSGNCVGVGVDIFFPRRSSKVKEEFTKKNLEALKLCWWCPARRDCLGFALENGEEDGIWGGISAEERDEFVSAIEGEGEELDIPKAITELIRRDTEWCGENEYL